MIKELVYKIDMKTLNRTTNEEILNMNDSYKVKIRTSKPLMTDSCRENRTTDSIILVNDSTIETVAAGMIV